MIRIISWIFLKLSQYLFIDKINKNNLKIIFNTLKTLLMVLPLRRVWNFLLGLVGDRASENTILNSTSLNLVPSLDSTKILYDTP